MNTLKLLSLAAIFGLTITGCQTNESATTEKPVVKATEAQVAMDNSDYYEYHHGNRIHIFYDKDTFELFKQVGETSYRKTFIGEGPKGETLEFGLTKGDKKKPIDSTKASGVAGPDLYYGHMQPAEDFYAELWDEGRIYVFSSMDDLVPVRELGEPVFRYTMIGEGPKGETVVIVLNKSNKKQKPVELIAKFKANNAK